MGGWRRGGRCAGPDVELGCLCGAPRGRRAGERPLMRWRHRGTQERLGCRGTLEWRCCCGTRIWRCCCGARVRWRRCRRRARQGRAAPRERPFRARVMPPAASRTRNWRNCVRWPPSSKGGCLTPNLAGLVHGPSVRGQSQALSPSCGGVSVSSQGSHERRELQVPGRAVLISLPQKLALGGGHVDPVAQHGLQPILEDLVGKLIAVPLGEELLDSRSTP
mmetsp:Transcript_132631/g.412397  ORF Transcript_132631/g.412397 Transcript_132631/m.412397 type:complete len:220 (+) Transcript_132631:425-1084(+)